jgi:hypothetical protein
MFEQLAPYSFFLAVGCVAAGSFVRHRRRRRIERDCHLMRIVARRYGNTEGDCP